jgi:hypothetical protein
VAGHRETYPRRPLPRIAGVLKSEEPVSVREIAAWLAAETPLAVVSDYYATRYDQKLIPLPVRATAADVLTAMERHAGVEYAIGEDEKVIRLRSMRWPLDDLMEPPVAVVAALERALKTQGRLGLREYLLAAQLPEPQYAGLVKISEQKFRRIRRRLDDARGVVKETLRFYAALSPAQQSAAAGPGLPAAQLSTPQQQALAQVILLQAAGAQPREIGAAVFRVRREERPVTNSAPREVYLFAYELPGRPPLSVALDLGTIGKGS